MPDNIFCFTRISQNFPTIYIWFYRIYFINTARLLKIRNVLLLIFIWNKWLFIKHHICIICQNFASQLNIITTYDNRKIWWIWWPEKSLNVFEDKISISNLAPDLIFLFLMKSLSLLFMFMVFYQTGYLTFHDHSRTINISLIYIDR